MRSYLYFISGVSFGVGAALLLAPKSGAEMRSTLRDSLSEGQGLIKDQVDQVRNAVTDTIERSKAAVRSTSQVWSKRLKRVKPLFGLDAPTPRAQRGLLAVS
jgi:gas vesicle protein